MKLKVLGDYGNTALGLVYESGSTIEVEDERGAMLMRDAPDCFEEVKAVTKPPANKAQAAPAEDK